MSRALIIIRSNRDRERAAKWCLKAPSQCRIEFKETKRSLPQNDKFWAMLSDVASQKEHFGRRYSADVWKLLFMDEYGRETKFVPSLDGSTVVPIGQSSSDLTKDEMSELIEFIASWGAENGVIFHDGKEPQQGHAA
jgi:hypothetical protein